LNTKLNNPEEMKFKEMGINIGGDTKVYSINAGGDTSIGIPGT